MDPFKRVDELRKAWIDQFVVVNPDRPELRRFANVVGRVVTVNYNEKAVVDFQDGGWYDVPADPQFLTKIDPEEGRKKYKNVNSSQAIPERQT
jgi:hypothetical protein